MALHKMLLRYIATGVIENVVACFHPCAGVLRTAASALECFGILRPIIGLRIRGAVATGST